MIYYIVRTVLRILYAILFRLETCGLERIPATGPVIVCCNHISYFDPPTVGIPLSRKIHYMAKSELFKIPLFGSLITSLGAFPVKRGGVSKDSIKSAIALLQSGGVMGIFPEGSRHAEGMGKKGAALIALRSGAAIVPAAIIGNYKLFRKMKVRYGQPMDLSAFMNDSSSDVLERLTEAIMAEIRELHRKG